MLGLPEKRIGPEVAMMVQVSCTDWTGLIPSWHNKSATGALGSVA